MDIKEIKKEITITLTFSDSELDTLRFICNDCNKIYCEHLGVIENGT